MGKKYTDRYRDDLLCQVFRLISKSHFGDHKMGGSYCTEFRFKRSLGDNVANFVQTKYPEIYAKEKKNFDHIKSAGKDFNNGKSMSDMSEKRE